MAEYNFYDFRSPAELAFAVLKTRNPNDLRNNVMPTRGIQTSPTDRSLDGTSLEPDQEYFTSPEKKAAFMRMIAAAAAEENPHQAGHFTQESDLGADTDFAEQLHLDRQMVKAWNVLKMRFQDYQDKAKNMKDDIDFRYARENDNPKMMSSLQQDTVNQGIVDRLVHDKMQENMEQGKVGEQTTDALASKRPLFVPRFDARAIHPKYTVADQSKLPHSMSDIYTDTPSINYYDPKNYDE